MNKIDWSIIKEYELLKGLFGRFVHKENMTIARWRFEEGVELIAHDHPNEQLTMIVEGTFELRVGKKVHLLGLGDMVPIPPNIPHSGKAITETIAIHVWSPPREDFKEKYL